jgi:hypothetical protein
VALAGFSLAAYVIFTSCTRPSQRSEAPPVAPAPPTVGYLPATKSAEVVLVPPPGRAPEAKADPVLLVAPPGPQPEPIRPHFLSATKSGVAHLIRPPQQQAGSPPPPQVANPPPQQAANPPALQQQAAMPSAKQQAVSRLQQQAP